MRWHDQLGRTLNHSAESGAGRRRGARFDVIGGQPGRELPSGRVEATVPINDRKAACRDGRSGSAAREIRTAVGPRERMHRRHAARVSH